MTFLPAIGGGRQTDARKPPLRLHAVAGVKHNAARSTTLTRIDTPNLQRAKGTSPQPKLKSIPVAGIVTVDEVGSKDLSTDVKL